ncbi:hypothetical protein SADUNF_Sadunf16G0049500 [Salix dunnii]|uniref:NAC domain-containing protein n=1 Tax=Salix dunnii TaxID=1413687 RepID=A0A835J755_9ROSI|nr:hypothetical protein SADUNF_Sadunf16G0049500 [Salix dunnii]
MSSNSNSSSKKMKVAGSNYESNSNDIQFGANILNNASSCMFPDRFSQPNNAMIAPYSPPNFVSRLDQPQHRVNVDAGSYIDPYFRTLPPGIRFCPKDEELVVHYLMKKIRNEPLPRNRIHEVNIYEYHPKTLAEKYKLFREQAWYFFTTRVKKYPNGSRPDRGVPGGFWKPTGSPDTKIFDEHSNTVIERRSLDFYEGKGKTGRRTDWKMHEYYPATTSVSSTNTQGMRLNECILCRIYLKGGKQKAEVKTTCEKSRMNVAGTINGPSFSMPLTMHGAGLNQPNSSMPLTMHVAGLNGATSSMHGAGLNGPSSSKPPTTLPGNTMDADDHLVELDSLPDSDFHDDDDIARILETFLQ